MSHVKCSWCNSENDCKKVTINENDEMIYGVWICKHCRDMLYSYKDFVKLLTKYIDADLQS